MRCGRGLMAAEREVFTFLHGNYLFKSNNVYQPYAEYESRHKGYFEVVEALDTKGNPYYQTKIPGEGRVALTIKVMDYFS